MRDTGQLLKTVVVYLGLCGCAAALPGTRVQDVLYNADGTRTDGTVSISWKGFTASDGSTLTTNTIDVRIVQGLLNVELVPNENATPTGTSYQVSYLLDNGSRFFETWVVPESPTPVTVSQVRVTQPRCKARLEPGFQESPTRWDETPERSPSRWPLFGFSLNRTPSYSAPPER